MAGKSPFMSRTLPLCASLVAILMSCQSGWCADPMGETAPTTPAAAPEASRLTKPIPPAGFAVEGFAGGDTSLSGSYGTTTGQTVPYDFGSAPLWGVRIGKMLFSPLFVYLTFQQTYFSRNTHSIIGFGGQYYLPTIPRISFVPYLNATFGGSYNTYTGPNAQAGYAWMLGAGVLYPLTQRAGVFLEADASYETAPTGITTSIGSPPGIISRVSDTWSIPVMIGLRVAF